MTYPPQGPYSSPGPYPQQPGWGQQPSYGYPQQQGGSGWPGFPPPKKKTPIWPFAVGGGLLVLVLVAVLGVVLLGGGSSDSNREGSSGSDRADTAGGLAGSTVEFSVTTEGWNKAYVQWGVITQAEIDSKHIDNPVTCGEAKASNATTLPVTKTCSARGDSKAALVIVTVYQENVPGLKCSIKVNGKTVLEKTDKGQNGVTAFACIYDLQQKQETTL